MSEKVFIALFQDHHNDPLSFLIKAATRGSHCHAAVVVDRPTNTIVEAYYPHVRKRQLANAELPSIDIYSIEGITPEQESKVIEYCEKSVEAQTKYSIEDLFRFLAPVRAVLGEASDDGSFGTHKFCSMFATDSVHSSGFVLLNAHSYEIAPSQMAWSPRLRRVSPLAALAPTGPVSAADLNAHLFNDAPPPQPPPVP